MDLNVNEWEDEKKLEEIKSKTRVTLTKKLSKEEEEQLEEQEQETGFCFRSFLGVQSKVTIEGFERVKEQINLEDDHFRVGELEIPAF